MTFTAVLPSGIELPEETWLPARVRRHGDALEVTAEGTFPQGDDSTRTQALKEWLERCAAQPVCALTDDEVDELRWEGLKDG